MKVNWIPMIEGLLAFTPTTAPRPVRGDDPIPRNRRRRRQINVQTGIVNCVITHTQSDADDPDSFTTKADLNAATGLMQYAVLHYRVPGLAIFGPRGTSEDRYQRTFVAFLIEPPAPELIAAAERCEGFKVETGTVKVGRSALRLAKPIFDSLVPGDHMTVGDFSADFGPRGDHRLPVKVRDALMALSRIAALPETADVHVISRFKA